MGHLTVRIPDHLHVRMKEVPINWSEVVRASIEARLAQAERERVLNAWMQAPGPEAPAGTAGQLLREDRDA